MGNTLQDEKGLPTISVLVLNYNDLEHLDPCFTSLQALDYPADKLELVFVDNHSSDGSVAFMQNHFPDVKIVLHSENYGFSQGNNLAAAQANGQLVAFLNTDMRVDPRWLVELVQPVLHTPGIVCAASKILSWDGQRIDYAGLKINLLGYGFHVGWGELPTTHTEENLVLAPCGGAMLIDREIFLEIGGFDQEYFAFYEDLDLGWRLWVMGYKVAYVPGAITYHVHHGSWGRVPDEKMTVLYHRNALSSVFKNYSDQSLSRVLPAALLLYVRRTFIAADLDMSDFRSESSAIAPHLYAEIPHPNAPLVSDRATFVSQVYDLSYYVRETWRTLLHQGPLTLLRKAISEMRRRSWRIFSIKRLRRLRSRPGHAFIARKAISHLVAADDVVRGMGQLMRKRQNIQKERGRPDEQVFELFGWPFASDSPDPHYAQTMKELIAACDLPELFEQGQKPQ